MRNLLSLLFACAVPAACLAQGLNEKLFYSNHTSASVRDTAAVTNRLYFMQPEMGHRGYGRASGFRGVFQDQEQRTAETIRLAFVRYAQDRVRPDVSAAGVVTAARYTIFGTGSGLAAYRFTFTLSGRTTLPATVGIRATLPPAASWPSDGVSIHYQSGTTTRLPAGVTKPQWTWRLAGTSAQTFAAAASTLFLGGLFEEGVTRVFVSSTAYGLREDLFGAEALFPDPGRGDRVGFAVANDGFKGRLGIVVLSSGYAAPASVPPFGTLLVHLAGAIFLPAIGLDAGGAAKTPAVAIPRGLRLATQSLFLDPTVPRLRLSDAARLAGR